MKDEVATLKKDFKQKENKYLEDFLDMKALKEKVEDKLFKQDESLQTVHMLCKPKPYYDEKKKVAIGYKNPLYLTRAMQVQSALYNGHEIVKTNHAPAVVLIMEYLVNISKRHAFWSLIEDILKITILTTNTPYTLKKIRRIRACTHQRPQKKPVQYAISSEDQYAVLEI
ncbi:hypothetical protein Tco_1512997 [Tanacetum coccineum]